MAIGILALAIGSICIWISSIGISEVEPPKKSEKMVRYPYPKEI